MSVLLDGVLTGDLLDAVRGESLNSMPGFVYSGRVDGSPDKHLIFLVERGASRPFALVKWGRNAKAAGLLRELGALKQVRAAGDTLLASSCPPIWGPFSVGQDSVVTVERALDGRPAYAELRTSLWPRRCAADHFRRAVTWIEHFSAVTRQAPIPLTGSMLEEEIEDPLIEYCRRLDSTPSAVAAIEATLSLARALVGQTVTPVAEHGDLWIANLLVPSSGTGVYIVDWEHYRPAALPGFDMLIFSTTYGLVLPWRPYGWAGSATAFSRTYVQRTWLSRHVMSFLARGCRASGLSPAWVPVLLPVAMARMALRRAEEHGDGATAAWVEALRAWWQRPAGGWLDEWARP